MSKLANAANVRILVADDNRDFLRSVGSCLDIVGFGYEFVSSAEEAVAALGRAAFDLLITDVHMPGNHELELLGSDVVERTQIPVIVVTAYPTVPGVIDALRLEAVDFLVKPFSFNDLVASIRNALSKGRPATRRTEQIIDDLDGLQRQLRDVRASLRSSHQEAERARLEVDPRWQSLSKREGELVLALARGKPVGVLAKECGISPHTVRNHLKAAYRKFEVHSQVELVSIVRDLLAE